MAHQAKMGGILGVLWCARLAVAAGVWAHAQAGDTVYPLHGTVVNGITGQPVSRALVVSADRRLAALTNGDGHFAIEVHVPAASANGNTPAPGWAYAGPSAEYVGPPPSSDEPGVALMVEKPGFLARPAQGTFVGFDSSLQERDIRLRLLPTATLTGRVTAEGADAPHGIAVSLMQHRVMSGRLKWIFAGMTRTDHEGLFSISGLAAGEYTAMTIAWRGNLPEPDHTQVTQQYPPDYLGDASTLDSAEKLQLQFGDTAHIELHLHRAAYYPVTIPLAQPDAHQGGMLVRVLGGNELVGPGLSFNSDHGAVEGSLPSGEYTVTLTRFNGPPIEGHARPSQSFSVVSLHVADHAVRTAPATLAPLNGVAVEVHYAPSVDGSRRRGANLTLQSEDPAGGGYGGNLEEGRADSFTIQNVPPGSYAANGNTTTGYLAALTCDGVNLLRDPLVIGAGGLDRPIVMEIRNDGGSVSGQVTSGDGTQPQGRTVLLVSADGSARAEFSSVSHDGSYRMSNVPPGNYRLFATEDIETVVPYQDAEAMRAYVQVGVPVTVEAGQQQTMDAPVVDASQLQKLLMATGGTP